jgi:hypothetical protein
MKTNLSSGISETFLFRGVYVDAIDPLQKWMALSVGQEDRIISIDDTARVIPFEQVKQILYSPIHNTIYVISPTEFNAAFGITISGLNPISKGKRFSLPLPYGMGEKFEAFLSSDEDKIYIPVADTCSDSLYIGVDKILCFSTQSNSLIGTINLKEISGVNAGEYYVESGNAGKCVIESYVNKPNLGSYYRVCNLDSSTQSEAIFIGGYSKPFLLKNGEYLLVSDEYRDTVNDEFAPFQSSGSFSLYNTKDMKLIKNFILPANLQVRTFSNYQNMIYCIDIADSNNFFIRRNIDSIIACSSIMHISPAITCPNSGSFILEVTGKGFKTTSKVLWNDSVRTTTFVSDSLLRASILAADVATVGNKIVRVKYDSTSSAVSDSMLFSVVTTLPKPIRLVIEKEIDNHNGTMTAWFGYLNVNDRSVYIPVGDKNSFSPTPIDRGQATIFLPGRHKYVFGVTFPSTINIEWQLNGRRAKAGSVCEN